MDISLEDRRLVFSPETASEVEELAQWHNAVVDGPGLRVEVECVNPHRAAVFLQPKPADREITIPWTLTLQNPPISREGAIQLQARLQALGVVPPNFGSMEFPADALPLLAEVHARAKTLGMPLESAIKLAMLAWIREHGPAAGPATQTVPATPPQ